MTTAAYEPIVTQAGLNAAARAQADGRVLQITHVAVGTGAYAPTAMEIALRDERARAPVHRRKHIEAAIWQVAATITGDADYFASEVGFFADDEGTPVLMFLYSSVERVFAAVTTGQETLLELAVSLSAVPAGTVEFSFLDADVTEQEMLDDMSGKHLPGNNFNFALTRNIKEHMHTSMEQFELMANIRRGYGQSGIRMGRHYGYGGDAAYHRPSVVNFAAFGVHNHPNYPLMCGMPEIDAIVNGYEVATRHIDYRIMHSIGGGAYLEVEDAIPPAVPPSVAAQATPEDQITEMREYLRAFAHKDASIRDYAPHFDTYLSVLEVWLEVLDGDELVDTFPSFRHQLSGLGHKRMNDDYMALLASGMKSRFENEDFKPTVIRVMRPDGSPSFGVLRYRVSAVRLGDYATYPIHEMTSVVDDPGSRQRRNMLVGEQIGERDQRFRVNHSVGDRDLAVRSGPGLLDEIMGKVPGLDGLGAVLNEEYTDTDDAYRPFIQRLLEHQSEDPLNGAFYRRFYSFETPGAAGRRHYKFGWNDPMLFRAATTRQEVVALPGMGGGHRLSWAIPMELIVATPLGSWNPYAIPEGGAPTGDGNSAATAFSNAHRNGRWYMTPSALFDGDGAVPDPADTDTAAWMVCGDVQARLMRGSGVYVHMPEMAGIPTARIRYPIAPVHHEGSFEFGHFQAVQQETRDALAVMTDQITNMKHIQRQGG